MGIQSRRERERAERHRLIIDTARQLAEAEGWDAVTVRKLADRIEYSQPVLYSHFAGKRAIVTAVAEDGIGELAATMRRARESATTDTEALDAVTRAYSDFAGEQPALYDAIFAMPTDLAFGPDAPESLKAAFGELAAVFGPMAGDADIETFTETCWSALHGLVTLERDGRLRPGHREQRLAILRNSLGSTRDPSGQPR